mmetsp:Transcript_36139/g.47670  ORF Transcript_36139/g.47670 Transcript_36139/m.47670 type:complete len:392 (+) Transcript_36139:144-1319(+)
MTRIHLVFILFATFCRYSLCFHRIIPRTSSRLKRVVLKVNGDASEVEKEYNSLMNKIDLNAQVEEAAKAEEKIEAEVKAEIQKEEILKKVVESSDPIPDGLFAAPVEKQSISGKSVGKSGPGISEFVLPGALVLGGIPAVFAAVRQMRMTEMASEEAQKEAKRLEQERLMRQKVFEAVKKAKEADEKRQREEIEELLVAAKEKEERLQRDQDAKRKAASDAIERKRAAAAAEVKKWREIAAVKAKEEEEKRAKAAAEAKAKAEEELAKAEALKKLKAPKYLERPNFTEQRTFSKLATAAQDISKPISKVPQLVEIEKSKERVGLIFEMADDNILVYRIQDFAIDEVKQKLTVGDEIVEFNGKVYKSDVDLAADLRLTAVGEKLTFSVKSCQ